MQNPAQISGSIDESRLSVRIGVKLREMLEIFRRNPAMRLLAVVDDKMRPIGVVREVDIRNMLFNPFGHALMSNPGFGQDIAGFVTDCATVETGPSDTVSISAYATSANGPGLIVTKEGKFLQTLSADRLVEMMSAGRIARADQITQNSHRFTDEIVRLSARLQDAANRMQTFSETLVEEAAQMTDAAQNVAAGASQSLAGLHDVRERGRRLAEALEQLAGVATSAKAVRTRTHEVIETAAPQMAALANSTTEIRNIVDVISNVGRQTTYLALNAQIEAVRHSSTQTGFVAVASEIKQLALQTRGSADEISEKVDRIGKVVESVLSGHREIVQTVESVNTISGRIDCAVEEHSATSLVVAGYVEQAADATEDISSKAQEIRSRAQIVCANARELGLVSLMLQQSAKEVCDCSDEFVLALHCA